MIDIVHELRLAKGGNAKIRVLKDYTGDYYWQKLLVAMYDPHTNYYVGPPNDNTFLSKEDYLDADWDDFFTRLTALSCRDITGNLARAEALDLSLEYGEIARLVLGGSLKAGLTATTINKVYTDLIQTFSVMLAQDAEVDRFPIWGSVKYDGVRVTVRVKDGIATPFTRSGKILYLDSLIDSFKDKIDGWYDGELVKGNGDQASRTRITGDVNRVLKGSTNAIKDYTFMVFDYLTLSEWENQKSESSYISRLSVLDNQISVDRYIKMIQQKALMSADEINEWYEDVMFHGYEGLILRYPDGPYLWKRSANLIKKKASNSCILRCVDTTEGTGKYQHMIGALICEGVVDGIEVRVKLGSGLSDHDRAQEPEHYIGQDIDALYNDIVLAEKAVVHSLFLPRFKRVKGNFSI